MARYTAAYSRFVSRIEEVETLRRLAAARERAAPIELRNEINALCRGAIVLLCGHIEAYIKELGEVALNSITDKGVCRSKLASQLYYHIPQDVLTEVQETSDPKKIADKVFEFIRSDIPYWSRSGPFPQSIPADRFNKRFANPAFGRVRRYFNRFGYLSYSSDLAVRLRANYMPTVNMLDHVVDTRHKIAHGDPTALKTPGELRTMVLITRTFCGSTDTVFGAWCRDSFCAIR